MAADEEDCVSYACECVRLAALTDDEVIRHHLLELARHWIAMREKEYSDARDATGRSVRSRLKAVACHPDHDDRVNLSLAFPQSRRPSPGELKSSDAEPRPGSCRLGPA